MGFGGVDQGLGTHYRGYYTTGAALRLAIPAANAGDVALVNDTDTWWIWDPDTADWVDSGNAGGGDFVGPEGGTSDGELVAFADTSGKLGKKSNILGGNVFFRDGTRALTAVRVQIESLRADIAGRCVSREECTRRHERGIA